MAIRLLILMLAGVPLSGQAVVTPCAAPKDALPSESWDSIRNVPAGVIAVVSTPFAWQGLNQINPSAVVSEHRWRRFVPYGAPTVTETFTGRPSLSTIANSRPVIYLKASELEASFPLFGEASARLSHLRQTKKGRVLTLTKGSTSLNQKWLYTSKQDLPLTVRKLANSTIEVQPQIPLSDGEYLLSLGLDGSLKYEFAVHCSAQ